MTASAGGCLCGAVRFTAATVEHHHHVCHCGMCRRWSGGPLFATPVEGLKFEGEDNIIRYDSSDWAQRGFCKACGTNLFYYLKPAGKYIVGVGAFDDPAPFEVVGEIYIDRKPPGYALAGDHPRLTEAEFMEKFMSGGA